MKTECNEQIFKNAAIIITLHEANTRRIDIIDNDIDESLFPPHFDASIESFNYIDNTRLLIQGTRGRKPAIGKFTVQNNR